MNARLDKFFTNEEETWNRRMSLQKDTENAIYLRRLNNFSIRNSQLVTGIKNTR